MLNSGLEIFGVLLMKRRLALAAAVAATSALLAAPAFASTWLATGAAQAVITSGANSLSIDLTSLFANPTSAANEVSGIQIVLDSTPGSVSLSSASGTLIDISDGGSFTTNAGSITHWGTALSGGTIFLATAGTGAVGGKPIDLIIDGGGDYSNANPSITGRNPQIQGAGTFVLSLTGAPSPVVKSVVFEFGTTPDSTVAGVCARDCGPGGGVPEPASWALMLAGFGGLGAALRTQRRRARTALA